MSVGDRVISIRSGKESRASWVLVVHEEGPYINQKQATHVKALIFVRPA